MKRLGIAFLLFIGLIAATTYAAKDSIIVAQWNTENFFDPEDDPDNEGDDEYTSSGWTRWTEYRYRLKLTNIAEIITNMKADIICLEEIENRRVLDDLVEVLQNVYHNSMPYITHRDSIDMRGIDCAILSRFKPEKEKFIPIGDWARESPCAEYRIDGKRLLVIANHWKSRSGKKTDSDSKRRINAEKIRTEYQTRIKKSKNLAVIVAGDFNDNVGDEILLYNAMFRTDREQVIEEGNSLFCLSALLPEEKRGTYFYSQTKTWNSFDSMNVSRGLLPKVQGKQASPWVVDLESYRVYIEPKMCQTNEFCSPLPTRRVGTKKSHYFLYGYSDHFPVLVKIKVRNPKE